MQTKQGPWQFPAAYIPKAIISKEATKGYMYRSVLHFL